jgi:hypothetical protein
LIGEKHSCDTSKIAQTCRSSIAVLNPRPGHPERSEDLNQQFQQPIRPNSLGTSPPPPRFPLRHVSYRIIRLFLGAASETTYTVRHAEPKQPVRTPHTRGQR